MRRMQTLRMRILDAAHRAVAEGFLDRAEDVFFLRGEDLDTEPISWRSRVVARRARWEAARSLRLPDTAERDTLERRMAQKLPSEPVPSYKSFQGIGLGSRCVRGVVVRAHEIGDVFRIAGGADPAVLVVATLEPSWSVVFPRFSAVVAELGGELSHAAILLREAGISSVVNARGAFHSLTDGETVEVDPIHGQVTRINDRPAPAVRVNGHKAWKPRV